MYLSLIRVAADLAISVRSWVRDVDLPALKEVQGHPMNSSPRDNMIDDPKYQPAR